MTFETKKQLIEWLENNNYSQTSSGNFYAAGTYYLSHGEYEKPEFKPTRYKDGWSVKGIYFYYNGTLNAPQDGRVSNEFFTTY